jgi:hypothetical protein
VETVSPNLASKHVATGFLVEPLNQGQRAVSGLASKPLGWFLPVWPQNRWRRISWLSLKIKVDSFSWFGLKTGGDGFPNLDLKTDSYALVIWASKSP